MNRLGLGALIHALGGGSENYVEQYVGRKIKTIDLVEDHPINDSSDSTIAIEFEDGTKIAIFDNGRSCCEHRYTDTDDELSDIVGGVLSGILVKDADDDEADNWGDEAHDIQFLEIVTDKGSVIFSTHNSHNGYYGGFGLTIKDTTDSMFELPVLGDR